MGIVKKSFGKSPEGKEVFIYELTNKNGMIVRVTDYGAVIVNICVPDKDGKLRDVVLGYDTVEGYYTNAPHLDHRSDVTETASEVLNSPLMVWNTN